METKDQVRELRNSTGMNRKEFCEYFGIPYRTVTEWERGTRKLPDYVLRMMAYQVKMEKLNVKNKKGEEENGKGKRDVCKKRSLWRVGIYDYV